MEDATKNYQPFRLNGLYAPNDSREQTAFPQWIEPFLTSHRVVLPGDWKAVFSPNINRTGTRLDTKNPDVKPCRGIIDRLDHADKFRN